MTVRDDGRGIAREALERVLEPGVSGGNGDGRGTGLGLANVNRRLTAFYGEGVRLRRRRPVRHASSASKRGRSA